MEGIIVGVDLCDEYTQVNCVREDKIWTVPTVICKNRKTDEWYVGEEAYAHTLQGDGIIVDKLVKLVLKDGTATLGPVRYTGTELLQRFLEQVIELPLESHGTTVIRQMVITVRRLDLRLIPILYEICEKLQIKREQVHILSHAESFTYYILSQKKEIWNGTVGMFDLSREYLRYYELKMQRGLKRSTVICEYEQLEEGFNLDILDTPSGAKLADKILTSCAERLMAKKAYSSVILSGRGFEKQDWAVDFMKVVCSRRRVFMDEGLFAKGAAFRAMDYLQEQTSYPYVIVCEGRLKASVSMNVIRKGQEASVVLAAAGENWYDKQAELDVMPWGQDTIDMVVTPLNVRERKVISIPLEGFPKRPERTTKVRIQVSFLDEKTMNVKLKDQGLGELFPASEAQIRQEVML